MLFAAFIMTNRLFTLLICRYATDKFFDLSCFHDFIFVSSFIPLNAVSTTRVIKTLIDFIGIVLDILAVKFRLEFVRCL